MNNTTLNIVLVLVFMLFGGLFAAAELALVSLRDGQIKALRERGRRGEVVADLASEPNRFLSSVQIGVTLSGFLSAAFGGATLADDLAPAFEGLGVPEDTAGVVALVVMTVFISYLSIVLSELTAKRIALQRPVGVSYVLGPSIDKMSRFSRPVIWLLSVSTNLVVRLLGGDPHAAREEMSDEELRHLVNAHETLSEEEKRIVDDVFTAGDRQVREVMVPRPDVDFLEASMLAREAADLVLRQPHSRYPVIGSSTDDVVGFLHVRDLLDPAVYSSSHRVADVARRALLLPDTRDLLSAMSDMRRDGVHLAVVIDEYGGTAGIVTLEDLVEEIVGDIKDEYDQEEVSATRLVSGETEVDGRLNLDDFADETGVRLPDGPYETAAGYVIAALGHLPEVGEECVFADGTGEHVLTVVEVEGRRISRVRVRAASSADADA
ncbi:MAG: hemolysin family protein [Actinomycetota bacterium]|nr:hemolysin family protein [Actinomycetota bacterium]